MSRIALPSLLLLAGCATAPDNAPSLLPRAVERQSNAEPTRPVPVAAPDAKLDADIAQRGAAFDAALRAFEQAADAARPRIARGARAAQGSDGWIEAQSAIGELDQANAELNAAMADIEQLAVTRAAALAPPYPALEARIAAAQASLERSRATLDAIKGPAGS